MQLREFRRFVEASDGRFSVSFAQIPAGTNLYGDVWDSHINASYVQLDNGVRLRYDGNVHDFLIYLYRQITATWDTHIELCLVACPSYSDMDKTQWELSLRNFDFPIATGTAKTRLEATAAADGLIGMINSWYDTLPEWAEDYAP